MKKYSDVLAEQAAKHTPMTAEDLNAWSEDTHGPIHLLDEIMYLRSVLAECYMWMGRRPQTPLPKKYQWAIREAYRIYMEDRK